MLLVRICLQAILQPSSTRACFVPITYCSFLPRIPDLQREGEATTWRPSGSHLQLRAAPLHQDVLGEGGRQESACGLSVRQVQVDHQPGSGGRRHSAGPAGGHAPSRAAGGRAGHSPPAGGAGAGVWEQCSPPASTGLRGPEPAGSGRLRPGRTQQPAAA